MTDAELRERIWQQVQETLFISRDQYMRDLEPWTLEPVEIDGKVAFVIMVKGPAIHLVSFRTGHKFPLRAFTRRVQALIEQHGHVETKTPIWEAKQQALNEAFGFTRVGQDEYDVVYRLDRLPRSA